MKIHSLQNVLVVVNPISGSALRVADTIHEHLDNAGIKHTLYETEYVDHATEILKKVNLQSFDAVAVYGGDGTLSEVVRGIYPHDIPVIVLPGGTGNVIASSLKIPGDIQQSITIFTSKNLQTRKIDIGLLNGTTPFILLVSVGILADMGKHTSDELKTKFGKLAYAMTLLKLLEEPAGHRIQLDIDGRAKKHKAASLVITNSGNVGIPQLDLFPQIKLNDGKFDLMLIDEINLGYIASVTKELVFQEFKRFKIWQGQRFHIELDSKATVLVDDAVFEVESFDVEVSKKQLSVLVGRYE